VRKAVGHVNGEIAEALLGVDAATSSPSTRAARRSTARPNKGKLGANAILGRQPRHRQGGRADESAAAVPLPRRPQGAHLPVPMMNILNGGAHADNNVDFQEFMVMPVGAPRASPRRCAWASRSSTRSRPILASRRSCHRGRRRGRLRPRPGQQRRGARAHPQAIEKAGYKPGSDISLALDVAATEFYDEGATCSPARAAARSTPPAWSSSTPSWCAKYPIVSIEDGMAEDDWDGWKR
jgi:enolase